MDQRQNLLNRFEILEPASPGTFTLALISVDKVSSLARPIVASSH